MKRWKRDEPFRKQARKAGYRSRAAFKILEIDKRFEILKNASRVLDLCSSPGSWLQVVKERCLNPESIIVGVDNAYVKPIPGIQIIKSSIESPELISELQELFVEPVQVVLSDCSPKLSGNKSLDRERQLWLAQLSYELAKQLLGKNGHFVTKGFQSDEFRGFVTQVRKHFHTIKTYKPAASFKRSAEMYLIAKGFVGASKTVNQVGL